MRIIAQKSNTLNTQDFFKNGLIKDYIDALGINVAFTKDEKLIIYNSSAIGVAITNTINNSTLNELQRYEILPLEDALQILEKNKVKKDLYFNLNPSNAGLINNENIEEISSRITRYVEELKKIIDRYKSLTIHLHSVNRNLIDRLKQELNTQRIGFAVTGNDLNFIDVDYYVLISNTQNDAIIDMLLKMGKEVIIYILSDYYISYLYEHYLGEESTPALQQTFQQLAIMSNYPEIIYKVFKD